MSILGIALVFGGSVCGSLGVVLVSYCLIICVALCINCFFFGCQFILSIGISSNSIVLIGLGCVCFCLFAVYICLSLILVVCVGDIINLG